MQDLQASVFIWPLYLDSIDWRLGVTYMGPYGLDHMMYGLLSLDRIIGVHTNADLHYTFPNGLPYYT